MFDLAIFIFLVLLRVRKIEIGLSHSFSCIHYYVITSKVKLFGHRLQNKKSGLVSAPGSSVILRKAPELAQSSSYSSTGWTGPRDSPRDGA